jgi:alpha-N-acetylglucosaminidase
MAMNGINMPLAFTGQEYVWAKTFLSFGFTMSDMETFFSGPGFFAWQRMGNIQEWGGPLLDSAIMDQYYLQIQILARMNSFQSYKK